MKTHILISLLATLSFTFSAQAADSCRLSIENFAKLIDANSVLADQVVLKLAKKNITLIDEEDVKAGDFQVSGLIRGDSLKTKTDGFTTWPYTPYAEGRFTSKLTLNTLCVALCAPILKEQGDLVGKVYRSYGYSISVSTNGSNQVLEKGLQFKHRVRNYKYGQSFVGSQEQVDLALAIVKEMPKCSQLLKLQSK